MLSVTGWASPHVRTAERRILSHHCFITRRSRAAYGRAHRRASLLAVACLACVLSASPVAAQQRSARDTTRADSARADSLSSRAERPAHLTAVTVTTTPADRREPSSATHVSRAAIELAPAATPWELLRQTAAVEVHQAGQGPGFASDASLRGFSSDHSTDLALWIDGVPVNEPVNGHAEGYGDWSLIFPETVRDIDVIKGPTSALYGNFALSGVVNVRTVERTTGTDIGLTGGSFGRAEASLLSGYDHGLSGGGVFGLRARHEDGFRPNGSNDLTQAHARIVREVAPSVTLDAGAELYGARWSSPGYLSEQEFAAHEYDVVSNPTDGGYKRHAQERMSVRVIHGDNVVWRTTAYATQGRWQLYLTVPPQGGRFEGSGSQTEEEDSRYGLGLTSAVTYATSGFTTTLGGESRLDHAAYQNYFTTARARDSVDALVTGRQLSGALFVQSGMDLGPRLRLDLGARYDEITTRSTQPGGSAGAVSAGHGVFSPKLGALVHVAPWLGVYGNVSRGFRSTDGVLLDPTLPPITLWAYETGVKLDRDGASASVALFRMDVSNEQTFNPLVSGSINGGSSRRRGVELALRTPVSTHGVLSTDWTFNDARYTRQLVQSDDPSASPIDLRGLRVYNTARYVGSAALDIVPPAGISRARWALRVSGNWVGPYSPFDEPGVVLAPYGLAHVSGRVQLTPSASLELGVRNVFDRAYPELVAGHIVAPGEPRAIFARLKYHV